MPEPAKNWEVVTFKYIAEDKNYEVKVIKYGPFQQKGGSKDYIRKVRLPFKPNIGQLISCPKLI